MALGTTLGVMIQMVQDEIISSSNPALGQNFRPVIVSRIKREAVRLHADYDWPHLMDWKDKATAAGQRYYDWPTGVTVDMVTDIYRHWGSQYIPLDRGLRPEHYSGQDSDLGYRSDPPLRWRVKGSQYEIHPMPASSSSLRLVCKTPLSTLVAESDTCNIDDQLITLFASAKLLARRQAADATLVLAEANAHYATLKQRSNTGEERVNFASGGADQQRRIGFQDKIIVGVKSA